MLLSYFHSNKAEIRSQEDARILRITKGAAASVESPLCLRWLEELSTHRGEGWQLIQKSLAKGEEAVGQALLQACKSMAWLEGHPGRRIRLAVLSAYATSDPHALDVNTLGGKLFLHLLSMGGGVRLPTERRRGWPSTTTGEFCATAYPALSRRWDSACMWEKRSIRLSTLSACATRPAPLR